MNPWLMAIFSASLILTAALAGYFLLAQPIWALLDCLAEPKRRRSQKIIWAGLMLILGIVGWSLVVGFWLGSAVALTYGLFATRSRTLRRATVIPLVLALILPLLPMSILLAVPEAEKQLPAPLRAKLATGRLDPVTFEEIPSETSEAAPNAAAERQQGPRDVFKALMVSRGGARALSDFTSFGPDQASARPVPANLQQVARSGQPEQLFALTKHEVGMLDMVSGRFTELDLDPALPEPSWPRAIAYDSRNKVLLFDSRGPLYLKNEETDSWLLINEQALDFSAMAYAQEHDCFYATVREMGDAHIRRLPRLHAHGAATTEIELPKTIPLESWMGHGIQLAYSHPDLVCLIDPFDERIQQRIYLIDPSLGRVRVSH